MNKGSVVRLFFTGLAFVVTFCFGGLFVLILV